MKQLRSVEEINLNTNVILRLDTDLPLDDGKILDNSRLKKSIPTIRYLLAIYDPNYKTNNLWLKKEGTKLFLF